MANLQERKIELIQWLSTIDDIKLLEKISDFKERNEHDWWDEISESEKASIDRGLADADAGKLNSHSKALPTFHRFAN